LTQSALKERKDQASIQSLSTVISELTAEINQLERQIDAQKPLSSLIELKLLTEHMRQFTRNDELISLLKSFGLEKMDLTSSEAFTITKGHDRTSFTPSTASTPLFQDSMAEREGLMISSDKKTRSELQMVQYDLGTRGLFWIEDQATDREMFYLKKVVTG
jgi:hypothetical protein